MTWSDRYRESVPEGTGGSAADRDAAAARLVVVGLSAERAAAVAGWLAALPDDAVALRPADVPPDLAAGDPLDPLLAATEAGLCALTLLATCRWCGAAVHAAAAVCDLEPTMRCVGCELDQEVALDGTVEALFRPLAPRRRPAVEPGALRAGPRFRLHHFHPGARAPDARPYAEAVPDGLAFVGDLAGGAAVTFPVDGAAGDVLEVVTLPSGRAHVVVVGEGTLQPAVFRHGRFESGEQRAAPGALELRNEDPEPLAAMALWIARGGARLQPASLHGTSPARDVYLHPRARARLSSALVPTVPLGIRDATVWFSDAGGSTALYEQLGDVEAWRVVQAHFAALQDLVAAHGGAVVKTLGDAVLAAFSDPGAAFEAAALAARHGAAGLKLRVGLHRGPVLAVREADRPDLYGRTVNLAARLEAVARPGELCLVRSALDDPTVAARAEGWSRRTDTLALKGFRDPFEVVFLT